MTLEVDPKPLQQLLFAAGGSVSPFRLTEVGSAEWKVHWWTVALKTSRLVRETWAKTRSLTSVYRTPKLHMC